MDRKKIIFLLLAMLAITGTSLAVLPVHSNVPPPWTVSLDANSIGNTDANPQSTNTVTKTFNVGAIVNASGTAGVCGAQCIPGVFGWQFSIVYDNTTVVPQGDPVALAANDAASSTVSFGGQIGTGNPNWAGKITASQGFGSFVILPDDATHQKAQVFFTILAPNTAVNIFPAVSATVKGNLLASVAFELIRQPSSPISFSLIELKLVDSSANTIPNINPGSPVTVTINNTPPVASFTGTTLASGDASCTPVTG